MDSKPPIEAIAGSLRRERARAGLNLSQLAARAGISKSTLSQLESGTGNPSVETLWALSTALNVPFALLIDPPRATVTVLRAGEGPSLSAGDSDYRAALVAAGNAQVRRDLYIISAEPGRPRRSDPHGTGVVEHVVLSSGRARIGPTDEAVELAPGDYIAYRADHPHVFEALEPGTTAVLASDHP
ncbi:helix-turn-helix domain-containing protein [Agilicoccus flavus]|uniref:helix-turn-helix domain-containing protein n=1 Tax=Agilicoccus flavus TaxID=2775968 RepID=UPI001CF6A976|nr:XRE family transcriptional regulator [Agilicoccus flavus]